MMNASGQQGMALVVVDGDTLDAAIHGGWVWAEAGPVFNGKAITNDAPAGASVRLAGMAAFYAPGELAAAEMVTTGRACWSIAGKGMAYECVIPNGPVCWASGIKRV